MKIIYVGVSFIKKKQKKIYTPVLFNETIRFVNYYGQVLCYTGWQWLLGSRSGEYGGRSISSKPA